jgi:hypothetical protein
VQQNLAASSFRSSVRTQYATPGAAVQAGLSTLANDFHCAPVVHRPTFPAAGFKVQAWTPELGEAVKLKGGAPGGYLSVGRTGPGIEPAIFT